MKADTFVSAGVCFHKSIKESKDSDYWDPSGTG